VKSALTSGLSTLASGLGFAEGPVWHPAGHLVFSDIVRSLRYVFHPSHGLRVEQRGTRMANGLALDSRLRLLVCEHATSSVVRIDPDGTTALLADRFQGVPLNSPNDVVVSRSGSIYFTDPVYGRTSAVGVERPIELDVRGVYRITPAGDLELLADHLVAPNGLCFSPDESVLYVNDSERRAIHRFDVLPNGSVGGGDVFVDRIGARDDDPTPDGMKVDEHGNVLVTGPGGIWVLNPDGRRLGTVAVTRPATNLAFGGDDLRTLFVTTEHTLHSCRSEVAGPALPHLLGRRSNQARTTTPATQVTATKESPASW
jgi:gluconolactonase